MENQYYWALTDEFIAHHGILGQKWGVRRYQNSDGSLTPEGRRRVQDGDSKVIKDIARDRTNTMYKNMSKDDLNKRRKLYKDSAEKYKKMMSAPIVDDATKKEYMKLRDDFNKSLIKFTKIREKDFSKASKDLNLDDYLLKRDVESAFSDISDKYIYSPVRRSMKSDDLKSKAKTTLKVVGDMVSGALEAGGWDALLRELI